MRHSAQNLTDGGGLVLVRKLFDRFGVVGWIDGRANRDCAPTRKSGVLPAGPDVPRLWIALLLYGGTEGEGNRVIDDPGPCSISCAGACAGSSAGPVCRTPRRRRQMAPAGKRAWSRSWTNWYGRMVRQRWALLARGVPKKLLHQYIPRGGGTRTVRHHHTGSRPHVQGSRRPLRVRHSAQNLTTAAAWCWFESCSTDSAWSAGSMVGRTGRVLPAGPDGRGVDRAAAVRRWGDR